MTEMIDLAHEEFKTANVNMFRYLKEEMAIMNEQIGTITREMELLKRAKWKFWN